MTGHDAWPPMPYEEWAPTKKTLQMCAQMLGKARLALSPPQPEWLHTCLYVGPRGLTTGAMPCGERVVAIGLDVFDLAITVELSDGNRTSVPLGPDRCVADVWRELGTALATLGVDVEVWDKPQETADATPLSLNTHDCVIDPEQAQSFHRLLCTLDGVFEEFRSDFFGRTGVQFWWGAFDFAVLLFSGEHAAAPEDRGYIMRYDLDAEHLNAGFWPGDDSSPYPGFYAYIHPRPDGCETARMEPEHAAWADAMGEWILPYEEVRESADPRGALLGFLRSARRAAEELGGWDALDHRYAKPVRPRRE